jgi:hypothetical protein
VSPVKYELGFYIPEEGILHSYRHENLKSYIALTGWPLQWRRNVFPVKYEMSFISHKKEFFIALALKQRLNVLPVKYELGFYMPEHGILHSYRSENVKSYIVMLV